MSSSHLHALLIGIDRYPHLPGEELAGCRNDVELMGSILEQRFDLASERRIYLLDEQATREGILQAFERLVERVEEDDAVVVYFAGHGSRVRCAPPSGGAPPGELPFRESLVAHDSGRGELPNRDVLDGEIDRFVRRLNQHTANVTLIFDCCHSGLAPPGRTVREIEPDERPLGASSSASAAAGTRDLSATATRGASGWLPRRRATLLAACQADEVAGEHHPSDTAGIAHGTFTFFLGRELCRAHPDTTWREVFERLAAGVSATVRRQRPLLEGVADRVLFGWELSPPPAHLSVVSVQDERVTLGGGAAHGVTVGSHWLLHPAGAQHGEPERKEGMVEVASVAATSSVARPITTLPADLAPGWRAFEHGSQPAAPELPVRLLVPVERTDEAAELARVLDRSALVRVVADREEPAEVSLTLLPPRSAEGGADPYPQLGALESWTWAGVGSDGHLAVRLQPASAEGASVIAADLEACARYRYLMSLDNRTASALLSRRVELVVYRRIADRLEVAQPSPDGGYVQFEEGEAAEFEIRNGHHRRVYVSVLEFGVDGAVSVLVPNPECPPFQTGSVPIEPGDSLRIGADHYQLDTGLELELPEGFPWAAEPAEQPVAATLALKVLATLVPTDFSNLEQGATRSLEGGEHPLEAAVAAVSGKGATRGFRPSPQRRDPTASDWAAITRVLSVVPAAVASPLAAVPVSASDPTRPERPEGLSPTRVLERPAHGEPPPDQTPAAPVSPAAGEPAAASPEKAYVVPEDDYVIADAPLEPGDAVGEYRVARELGAGAYGEVYAGEQPLIGKQVAIKVLHRRLASDEEFVSRFITEARAVNRIRHPNIIDIFSFSKLPDGRPYFVMELLDGLTLGELLDQEKRLSVPVALPILRDIAHALDAAHEVGITHRDLKPDNIFLATSATGGYFAKLLDFGIAKLTEEQTAHRTSTSVVMGTPRYMSPEQCRGAGVGCASDIYSFGVIIHAMLTGEPLYEADSAMDLIHQHAFEPPPPMSTVSAELPAGLDEPVLAMLAKRPVNRPATAGEAIAALSECAAALGLLEE